MTAERSPKGSRDARHLIGDVQRFGFLSAATVVDRYAGMVDRAIADNRLGPTPSPWDGLDSGWLVERIAQATESYLHLLAATSALIASRADLRDDAPALERIVLPVARPAGGSESSLWIHNPTTVEVLDIDVRVTSLMSSTGEMITGSAITVSPHRVARLDPARSRELRLHVDVPSDQLPGWYHGMVLFSAAPSEPIAVQLEVMRAESADFVDDEL